MFYFVVFWGEGFILVLFFLTVGIPESVKKNNNNNKKEFIYLFNDTLGTFLITVTLVLEDSGRKNKMFYLTTRSTHFYGCMASDIW